VTPNAVAGPIIVSVSPNTGDFNGGTVVTVSGANFVGVSSLTFGGSSATGIVVNQAGTQLTATTPAHPGGAVDVVLTSSTGSVTQSSAFTYATSPAAPGAPLVAPGDREVTVSWAQVMTGGDPASYTVTATPGGESCTVPFPGKAFPTASCKVINLTNGTAYNFQVSATNNLGTASSGVTAGTPLAVVNGSCGAADGVQTLVQPTGFLCGAGAAGAVSSVDGDFKWSCTGAGLGTSAQCSAPGFPSQGVVAGTTTLDTGTSCNVQRARLMTPPTGGPAGNINMPFGVVNFEMVNCSSNSARVRMTFDKVIEGMDFWKYVVNSQVNPPRNGWYQMPSNLVTISGNTAEFDIVDNGEWDSDPALGAIADPGGPGYNPNSLPAVPGVPTNIQATGSHQSATVSWNFPNTGGAPVRYTVAAVSDSSKTCTVLHPATSCSVPTLVNGQSYTFNVVAENAGGTGPAGISPSVIPSLAAPGVPGAPWAVAGNGQATVTVSAPGTGGAPTSYTVTASPGNAQCTITGATGGCTVTGLTNGSAYTFTSTATNSAGTSPPSVSSNSVTPVVPVPPLVPPGQPSNVQVRPGHQAATVSWAVPISGGQPSAYRVDALINGVPIGLYCEVLHPATQCTVQGLTNGQAYTFQVTATNAAGSGTPVVITTPVVPNPPVPPSPNPIPTLDEGGLLALASLMAALGAWGQRRSGRLGRGSGKDTHTG
jgi:hypothetical protein